MGCLERQQMPCSRMAWQQRWMPLPWIQPPKRSFLRILDHSDSISFHLCQNSTLGLLSLLLNHMSWSIWICSWIFPHISINCPSWNCKISNSVNSFRRWTFTYLRPVSKGLRRTKRCATVSRMRFIVFPCCRGLEFKQCSTYSKNVKMWQGW